MTVVKAALLLLVVIATAASPSLALAGGPPPCAPFCTPTPPPPPSIPTAPVATPTVTPPPTAAPAGPSAGGGAKSAVRPIAVLISLTPKRVRPNAVQHLAVTTAPHAPHSYVQVSVHFPGRIVVHKGHIDAHGKLALTWRVPDKTRPARAKVVVLIRNKLLRLHKTVTLPFAVIK